MNKLSEIPLIQAGKAWYFLSVYYARENWSDLITQINQFYQDRQDKFSVCLVSFAEDKGEKIELSLASSILQENLKNEIDRFFLYFMEKYPSVRQTVFPYGKVVWDNYPNNTLLWNRFRTIDYTDHYTNFHQTSFRLALTLIENDTSPDTLFSACLYLITKGLTCIESGKQNSALSEALHDASIDFRNYSHVDSVKALINEHIDTQEISLTLDSYWDESESEFPGELKTWLTKTKTLMNYYGYNKFCSFICTMLGLKGLHQLMILELINTWYITKQNTND